MQKFTYTEWLEARKKVISASEAACLLGLNPFETIHARKPEGKKQGAAPKFKGNSFTELGQILEPLVRQGANKLLGTNFDFIFPDDNFKAFYLHPEYQIGATPDALDLKAKKLLECKSCRPDKLQVYMKSPPEQYIVQVLVQLFCTDFDTGYLAIMGTDLTQKPGAKMVWPMVIYEIFKNIPLWQLLIKEQERYWNNPGAFKVNSDVKLKAKMLCTMIYRRIYNETY